jgi:hypothetical protein
MARKRHTSEEIIGKLRDELLNREIFYALLRKLPRQVDS